MAINPWDWYAYQDVGRDRLTAYLREDFQPGEAVRALLVPFRDLEYLHHQLFDMLSITRATGMGLDAFGELVKIARLGRSDDDYRRAILAKRFSSGGSGTPEEIKRAIKNIATYRDASGTEQQAETYLVDHYPAAWIAVVNKATRGIDSNFADLIGSMAIAGVHGYETHDYGTGGFVLSGIGGRLYNALGIAPTPVFGVDDQALGAVTSAVGPMPAPAAGDLVAPTGTDTSITLSDARGYSQKTATQIAHVTIAVGQSWGGSVHREGQPSTALVADAQTLPSAIVATQFTNNRDLYLTGVTPGVTSMIVKDHAKGDNVFISIAVVPSDIIGVNETYNAIGGSRLAGKAAGSVPTGSLFYGTFTESRT